MQRGGKVCAREEKCVRERKSVCDGDVKREVEWKRERMFL